MTESDSEKNVESKKGASLPQHLVSLAAMIGVMCGGSTMSWTAAALPMLKNDTLSPIKHITDTEGSWIGSLTPLGALIGALPAGYIADKFGRKWTLWSLGLPFLASWIMIALAKSVEVIYAARVICGIGLGAVGTIGPIYVLEIAETRIRGALGSYFQIMLSFGIFYPNLFGVFCSFTMLAVACGVVPIVFMVLFFFAPETPMFLLTVNRKDEALKALRFLRGSKFDHDEEINYLLKEIELKKEEEVSFTKAMKRKECRWAVLICFVLFVIQQLCGINAVTYYTQDIFEKAHSTVDPSYATLIVVAFQITSSFVSFFLIEKIGRKMLLIISALLMAFALAALGAFFYILNTGRDVSSINILPIIALVVYIFVFCIGFGSIPWLMTAEILSSEIKGVISGVAVAINWTLAFVVTYVYSDLINNFGPDNTFWLFGGCSLLGLLFVIFCVTETKGKTFKEIQLILAGHL